MLAAQPKWRLILLVFTANALLAIGLCTPCLTVTPKFGEFSSLVSLLNSNYGTKTTISVVSGVFTLLDEGNLFVGVLIAVFSVIFPIWKLGILWACILANEASGKSFSRLKLIEKISKLSMLDVFVLALIVVVLKGMPGGTEVQLEWGVYAFAISILLTLLLPKLIRNRLS